MVEQKIITFVTIMALATFKAVSLQLNGMLMKWKILQAMRDDAIRLARIHPAFIPVTGLKCSYAKISSPPSHMNTSKFYKGFRGKARSRKPGQSGQPGTTRLMWEALNTVKPR